MKMSVKIDSEIGTLEAVILHTPGPEVENMTPESAERALYSDILNLAVVSREYKSFNDVLNQVTNTYQIKELLSEVLIQKDARESLLSDVCRNEQADCIYEYLLALPAKDLAAQLIEGVPLVKDTLTRFLSNERYALQPLHNFFYTRDASMVIGNKMFSSRMSNHVREREALIMETIMAYHPIFKEGRMIQSSHLNPESNIFFEGGDFLVINEQIFLVGTGVRTSSQGVDFIVENLGDDRKPRHIIVQQLPREPESFIHLDMVFTMLDHDLFMIYEPVILNHHDFETVHIFMDNGKVKSIYEEKNIPDALHKLGISGRLARCGGSSDEWIQEREQWHSGANFFALGPGRIIGYERNMHTIEELDGHGLSVLSAKNILTKKHDIKDYDKYVITMEGSELARGGGGCRCMTMPVARAEI